MPTPSAIALRDLIWSAGPTEGLLFPPPQAVDDVVAKTATLRICEGIVAWIPGSGVVPTHALAGAAHTGIVGTVGNFMAINASGLPVDSTKKPADFAAAVHGHVEADVAGLVVDLAAKATKQPGATVGNLAAFVAGGDIADSGSAPGSFATAVHGHAASAIAPSTASFGRILSAADDTVQKALDTLDNKTLFDIIVTSAAELTAALVVANVGKVIWVVGGTYALTTHLPLFTGMTIYWGGLGTGEVTLNFGANNGYIVAREDVVFGTPGAEGNATWYHFIDLANSFGSGTGGANDVTLTGGSASFSAMATPSEWYVYINGVPYQVSARVSNTVVTLVSRPPVLPTIASITCFCVRNPVSGVTFHGRLRIDGSGAYPSIYVLGDSFDFSDCIITMQQRYIGGNFPTGLSDGICIMHVANTRFGTMKIEGGSFTETNNQNMTYVLYRLRYCQSCFGGVFRATGSSWVHNFAGKTADVYLMDAQMCVGMSPEVDFRALSLTGAATRTMRGPAFSSGFDVHVKGQCSQWVAASKVTSASSTGFLNHLITTNV